MSLLLDALKQAEETKKQATAKQDVQASPENSVSQLEEAASKNVKVTETESESALPLSKENEESLKNDHEPELELTFNESVEVSSKRKKSAPEAAPNVLSVGRKKIVKPTKKPVFLLSVLSIAAVAIIFIVYGIDSFSEQPIQYKPYNKNIVEAKIQADEPVTEKVQIPELSPKVAMVQKDAILESETTAEAVIKPELKQPVAYDDPATIKIKKRQTPSRISRQLSAAYKLLQQGDYQKAEIEYTQILARDPRQINALLGMANIQSNRSNITEARRLYESVLIIDQTNAIAQIGIIHTYQQESPVAKKKVLDEMLASDPDNANIHAEIGHAFAAQSKWNAAQKSYFKAFSLDSSNQIYAYNLAVSLDQLEKPNAAISYYQKALSLSDETSQPYINLEQVRNRLQELGQ
jgi:tetratricopeptide (TPR) repeat protein